MGGITPSLNCFCPKPDGSSDDLNDIKLDIREMRAKIAGLENASLKIGHLEDKIGRLDDKVSMKFDMLFIRMKLDDK